MLQLLAEMDGFDATKNVKVIAATTNRFADPRPTILPGRIDRVLRYLY
jgi:proteasome regulatory subunit